MRLFEYFDFSHPKIKLEDVHPISEIETVDYSLEQEFNELEKLMPSLGEIEHIDLYDTDVSDKIRNKINKNWEARVFKKEKLYKSAYHIVPGLEKKAESFK